MSYSSQKRLGFCADRTGYILLTTSACGHFLVNPVQVTYELLHRCPYQTLQYIYAVRIGKIFPHIPGVKLEEGKGRFLMVSEWLIQACKSERRTHIPQNALVQISFLLLQYCALDAQAHLIFSV